MLAPDDRQILLDGLRPEPGFVLDRAVGTTFSLDLDALLMAPLAFALFDVDAGTADADPIAILAAIRSYAAKTAVYCDGARIVVPLKERPLFQLLERTVKPVHVVGGAFHPKVWVLRFRETGGERRLRHRALVLSRNLTFDRSWDTVLRLDEDPSGSSGENGLELADFLSDLAQRATSDVVDDVLTTLPRASFAPPQGFDSVRFWPMCEGRPDPLPDVSARRTLVISPFATQGRLAQLSPHARQRAFVTRAETMDRLGGASLQPWDDVFVLHSEANDAELTDSTTLAGLHAKLYVFDTGTERRIFTGSANATGASTARNVEFLAELRSTDAATRVEPLLAEPDKGRANLRTLLVRRRPVDDAPSERTPEELEEERLEIAAAALAAGDARATAMLADDGRWVIDFDLPLKDAALLPGDRLDARLITAPSTWAPLERAEGVAAGRLVAGASSRLSSFIGLRLHSGSSLEVSPACFTVIATLIDAPTDREDRLLLDLLPDARCVMQLLFLLLADARRGVDAAEEVRRLLTAHAGDGADGWYVQPPLFENLVRTFAREPERLRVIRSVIERLSATDEGRSRIPADFLELWATFDAAMPAKDRR